jgi:hypothetical protein
MTDPTLTDRIITQGRALVRAIEALGTIEPTTPFERASVRCIWPESVQVCDSGAWIRQLMAPRLQSVSL